MFLKGEYQGGVSFETKEGADCLFPFFFSFFLIINSESGEGNM